MEANSAAPTLRDVNKSTAVLLWLCKLPISRRTQIPSPASSGVVNYSLIACILSLQRTGKSRTVLYNIFRRAHKGARQTRAEQMPAWYVSAGVCFAMYENPRRHLCASRQFVGCPCTQFTHSIMYRAKFQWMKSMAPVFEGLSPCNWAILRHMRHSNCIPQRIFLLLLLENLIIRWV